MNDLYTVPPGQVSKTSYSTEEMEREERRKRVDKVPIGLRMAIDDSLSRRLPRMEPVKQSPSLVYEASGGEAGSREAPEGIVHEPMDTLPPRVCRNGHDLTGNVYVRPNGHKNCLTCRRARYPGENARKRKKAATTDAAA